MDYRSVHFVGIKGTGMTAAAQIAKSRGMKVTRADHPGKQVWVVFQPHTYSRTGASLEGFAQELSLADRVFLVDVFASARENFPLDKVDRASFYENLEELGELLRESLTDRCALLVMGAGVSTGWGDGVRAHFGGRHGD